MASAIFGHQHIDDSVAEFNPQHLTQVAQQAGRKVLATAGAPPSDRTPGRSAADTPTEYRPRDGESDAIPRLAYQAGRGVGNVTHRAVPHFAYQSGRALGLLAAHSGIRHFARSSEALDDPISQQRRISLALVCAAVISFGCVATTNSDYLGDWSRDWVWLLATMLGGAIGSVFGGRLVDQAKNEIPWPLRRLLVATTAWLGGWIAMLVASFGNYMAGEATGDLAQAALWVSFVPLLVLDWREMMSPVRRSRLRLIPILTCGVIAMVLAVMIDANMVVAAGLAAGMAMTVQVASPFCEQLRDDLIAEADADKTADAGSSPAGQAQPLFHAAAAVPADHESADDPVDAIVVTPGVPSPYSRGAAAVLAAVPYFIGVCGLQRFYVGKIGSGVLFLLTFGVCGIGQLVDFVVILMGQFKDADERVISEWQGLAAGQQLSTPVNSWSSVPSTGRPLGPWLANVIGLILLAAAIGLGVTVAIDAPRGLIELEQRHVIDTDLDQTMEELLGTPNWSGTSGRMGLLATAVVFLVGTSILIFARRQHGIAHILSGVLVPSYAWVRLRS